MQYTWLNLRNKSNESGATVVKPCSRALFVATVEGGVIVELVLRWVLVGMVILGGSGRSEN